MKTKYSIEFDGDYYAIVRGNQAIASYRSAEAAIQARRDFEAKRFPKNWSRIPPAMRYAQTKLASQAIYV